MRASDVNATETPDRDHALVWAAVANRGDAVRVLAEAGRRLNVASKLTAYPHTQNGVGLNGLEEGRLLRRTDRAAEGWLDSAAMYGRS